MRVVAAVITQNGRILACRRAPGRAAAGKWEFPGGKVDPDESPEAALAREIQEELGVEVEIGALLHRASTLVGNTVIDLSCFQAWPTGELPHRSTDHDELRWVPVNELRALDWAEPDIPAVEALSAG
ncbi:(deoxy)nucleoside triphosphate pyrophosphohydrolase [Lysobacter korlensis]|uniref:8-oxo-dGTP diphosphatase n=1 Tax=Lysobacter korlensis TaxID=553636 RepID=A0ABV6RXM5_9GAMM